MPGFLLHMGATVVCSHGGRAAPTAPNPRVSVSGQAVVTLPTQYVVAGCPLPSNAGGPCVTAQYVTASPRVMAGGQPLLVFDSQAVCVPTGVPLQTLTTQVRVKAL